MLRSASFDTKRIKISGPPLYVLPRIIVLGSSWGHFGCCSFPDHFFLTFLRSSCFSMFSPAHFSNVLPRIDFSCALPRFVSQCSSPDHFGRGSPPDRFFLCSAPIDFSNPLPQIIFSWVVPQFILSHLLPRIIYPKFFASSFFDVFPWFILQCFFPG